MAASVCQFILFSKWRIEATIIISQCKYPNISISQFYENFRSPLAFSRFQGVQKWNIRLKWVKYRKDTKIISDPEVFLRPCQILDHLTVSVMCTWKKGYNISQITWHIWKDITYLKSITLLQRENVLTYTTQKMKFSIKDFSSKCDQIRRKLRISSHLLEKYLMENFIFV